MMDAAERQEMLFGLGAAAARAEDDPWKNFKAWQQQRQHWLTRLRSLYEGRGLGNARGYWEAFWLETFPFAPPHDSGAFLQRVSALATPADELFWGHIEDRKRDAGNVFLQIAGNTGIGKSSAALGIVERDRPWKRGELRRHLTFERQRLVQLLPDLEALDWVILDDEADVGGDNSVTEAKEMAAMEEQTRASQKHTIVISPNRKDHAGIQLVLEAFGWSKANHEVVMFLEVDGVKLGVVTLPFCSAEAYAEYKPMKDRQVKRALAAAFRDPLEIMRSINKLANDPHVQSFLVGRSKKPKKADFGMALKLFYERTLAVRTQQAYQDLWFTVASNWDVYKDGGFERQFGFKPTPGMEKIGKSCYSEGSG